MAVDLKGQEVANYRIVEMIGEGGMASVWRAEHALLGKRVAIKVLDPLLARDQGLVQRFLDKARVQCELRHPDIVAIENLSKDPLAMVMEYIDGRSLADILDALCADNRDELFVAGILDRVDGIVVLFRGTLEPVRLPLSWFPPAVARGARKGLNLRLTDCGQAVAIGDYEASAHAILYDLDPLYRRRAKKRRIAHDPSLGGALRRLRILRELPRTAFEPEVTAKEVARIEHGKVTRPHASTLEALARRLGVRPGEIPAY